MEGEPPHIPPELKVSTSLHLFASLIELGLGNVVSASVIVVELLSREP